MGTQQPDNQRCEETVRRLAHQGEASVKGLALAKVAAGSDPWRVAIDRYAAEIGTGVGEVEMQQRASGLRR